MPRLTWDSLGDKKYAFGVDRGVLFPKNGPGVPWNGLVQVTASPDGGDAKPLYLDGLKYENRALPESFKFTIEAMTYPDEFATIMGDEDTGNGLLFGQQDRLEFGLAYRTMNGDDTSENASYTLHIIYNALASPMSESYKTKGNPADPTTFSWDISTRGVSVPGRRPLAELRLDSRDADPAKLKLVEDVMYGTNTRISRQASISEFVELFDAWPRVEIIPDVVNGLSPLHYKGHRDLKGSNRVGLYKADVNTRLRQTDVLGLYKIG